MGQVNTMIMKALSKLSLVILFAVSSCITPRWAIDDFTYCFDNENTGLDSMLNLNGFYLISSKDQDKSTMFKKRMEYMFYKNGFSWSGYGGYWLNGSHDKQPKYSRFGIYILAHDTIKVQYMASPQSQPSGKSEVWFRILNRNSIELIYKGKGGDITKDDLANFKSDSFYNKYGFKYGFQPLDRMPYINDTYIINKKWFWCDKEKYKEWKKNHK